MNARKTDSPARWLREECERIRARRDLSETGKTAHIARVYQQAREQVDQDRKAKTEEWTAKRDRVIRRLFAPAQHNSEWRALRDEAVVIKDSDKALSRLEMALTVGDGLEA